MERIAVFPGSFDPITIGHVALVERAVRMFDKVIVAIGTNGSKKYRYSIEERLTHLEKTFNKFDSVVIKSYSGLTVEFCKEQNANFILRGIRNGTDLDFEKPIAQMNYQLSSGIDTVFLMTSPEHSAINSTIIRDIIANNGDFSSFVPKEIVDVL